MSKRDRILIVTGGSISLQLLREAYDGQFIIGVDKGLEALDKLDMKPQLVLGDFDSADKSIGAKYKSLPDAIILDTHKDVTDTHAAVLEALKRKPESIEILGATGGRLDHLLGNLGLLKLCLESGVPAYIRDEQNRLTMIDKQLTIKKKEQYGKYVSCIPFSDRVTGICLRGFAYDLEDASMIKEETVGISNEIREEEGLITIREGYLLVMETKD